MIFERKGKGDKIWHEVTEEKFRRIVGGCYQDIELVIKSTLTGKLDINTPFAFYRVRKNDDMTINEFFSLPAEPEGCPSCGGKTEKTENGEKCLECEWSQ